MTVLFDMLDHWNILHLAVTWDWTSTERQCVSPFKRLTMTTLNGLFSAPPSS